LSGICRQAIGNCAIRRSRANRPTFTDQEALLFHSQGRPGKLEVVATKPMATQRDLSLAYSPGVAVPVLAIAEDESRAYDYTTKGNFVAVITNGTAILGLGNRGALAAKPVMEGKSVLFKRFADVDSIDLEVSTEDPDEIINCVKAARQELGRHQSRRHQGAGMLHHRAAAARAARHSGVPRRPARHRDHRRGRPDQRARTHRPRHQDHQAGLQRRRRRRHRLPRTLRAIGFRPENLILCDTKGVIYEGRTEGMNQWKSGFAVKTKARTLPRRWSAPTCSSACR
jgi:malate dehydrogenase (oxaloacetate-decarboxylating)(NADP+)